MTTYMGTRGDDMMGMLTVVINSNDLYDGWAGNDTIQANVGNDTLLGGTGDDHLHGMGGRDVLKGGVGADRLNGGFQDDKLRGGAGFDVLDGDAGNDRLKGGAGIDAFQFNSSAATGGWRAGRDVVNDFTDGEDLLVLYQFGEAYDSAAEIIAAASQVGDDTVITIAGEAVIRLRNFDLNDLDASDMTFGLVL